MDFVINDYAVPLRIDESGVVRVVKTRVTIDTVVNVFNHGMTPEVIAENYDTLTLSDVYGVIAYYLRNRESVDAYLAAREQRGDELEREMRARFPMDELKARIQKRHEPVAK
ncbi:MAG: DUF433 domain-containing protein [Chloroflexota bacterium]|nr:DUF433 domain-containing protein [Chloroflexota bacterium]